MTRRTRDLNSINENPDWYWLSAEKFIDKIGRFCQKFFSAKGNKIAQCPYGQPGDILWVRETWSTNNHPLKKYMYKADVEKQSSLRPLWTPSIHMPREACRLFLEVVSIRVERVQDISRGDAMAEGCPFQNMASGNDPRSWFFELWESINGKGSWVANPWVWVVEFKTREQ